MDNGANYQLDDRLLSMAYPVAFSANTLIAAVKEKRSLESIKAYLGSYQDRPDFKESMSNDAWPALYHAAEQNSAELMSVLLQYNIDINAVHERFPTPLLAFVITEGYREAMDTTRVAKLLLACGADPNSIPKDMWIKYLETPREEAEFSGNSVDAASAWCTQEERSKLALSLHLTHRYLLHLANRLPKTNARSIQIAEAYNMSDLLKLPYFLIGQRPAADFVMRSIFSHVALRRDYPFVMAFAGASGLGKTEMARALGDLLSVKTTVIDCAATRDSWALFGPTAGWNRNQDGSILNNFLADNTEERSVVFLDEFDKTREEVRDALLLITENGNYVDRRTNTPVDCTKTIWIIATNYGSALIDNYYAEHIEKLSEDKKDKVNLKPLQSALKQAYKNMFKAPFTGRISLIVPFLPFTPSERSVIVHKFVLAFSTRIRQPIDRTPKAERFFGHCRLTLIEDGKICNALSAQFDDKDTGARELKRAVEKMEDQFVEEHNKRDRVITEDVNDGALQCFVVRRTAGGDDAQGVTVYAVEDEEGGL
ncbi:P-loop containing nucleoside triphosphate hydrolase protein [Massariosphaeria phaeospora]|uniref:P-loop containing nucleoside triphosphate hydrolase protein n=1 Tax=Massariosphaeria phaeospora TaxID=100035 RepID=A0A7C8MQX3_9PLEO|nr:P-loop containing nucleoside triphosphate hydrolase protein [Massariosphaeria phaeospora]